MRAAAVGTSAVGSSGEGNNVLGGEQEKMAVGSSGGGKTV